MTATWKNRKAIVGVCVLLLGGAFLFVLQSPTARYWAYRIRQDWVYGTYHEIVLPALVSVHTDIAEQSFQETIRRVKDQKTTVGVPALAGAVFYQDAMNASREAQRVASVAISDTVYQVVGYVAHPGRSVVLGIRNDRGMETWTGWKTYIYDGRDGLPDLGATSRDIHNWVSVGLDSRGYVHLTWDMHGAPLKYRRSDAPVNAWTGGLTQDLDMLGSRYENTVTYVRFHLLREQLFVTFRGNGGAGRGDWFFYEYNHDEEAWSTGPGLRETKGLLLDGRSDQQNPYLWRDPAMDSLGHIHFAWNWRASSDVDTNHRVEYIKWNGSNYVTPDDSVVTVPIREGEADTVDPVGFDQGLEDIGALAVDEQGHPHLAYRKDGPEGHMQMYHVWHDGSSWQPSQLTSTQHPSYFAHTFDGGMYLSGAAIAPLKGGRVALLFTNADRSNHLELWSAQAPFERWNKRGIYNSFDLGYYEPGFDRWLLAHRGMLHVPIIAWDRHNPSGGWPAFVLDPG